MPTHLHFDCFSGLSGNMMLGAMLDLGVPRRDIEEPLRTLPLEPWTLRVEEVRRGPLRATWCDVEVAAHDRGGGAHDHAHERHLQDHAHPHSHDHAHPHEPDSRAEDLHGRRFSDIRAMLASASLPARAKDIALRAFDLLARAEGRVHGMPPQDVVFHEVGAVDSIVDIVGTALAIAACGAERFSCAPLVLGSGSVSTRHGRLPLPAPATIELVRGAPVVQLPHPFEFTTPTGAALVMALVERFGPLPELVLSGTGYGAGADRPTPFPNVLRVLAGTAPAAVDAPAVVFETNIDNAGGEDVGHVLSALLAAGALDAFAAPVQMKKSRPAQVLTCICRAADQAALEDIVFRNLPALGIRSYGVSRRILDRRHVAVATPWGSVRVKEALRGGVVLHATPEYEDLRACADAHGIGIGLIRRAAMASYARLQERRAEEPPPEPSCAS
ncbi:MAG TPA: nickel pincer cofactor biosynthesis protein LarC [Planctomycetes bacterium]|nr:nickel pincer cofactor biosynthesis protein LarC [Planctomycetota bacterium]